MDGPSPSVGERRFAKRVDFIPNLDLEHSMANQHSIILLERDLVGKFLVLWPSPRTVVEWISKNWPKQDPSTFYCGKGFFVFLFKTIEDRDHIFRSGPYFIGFQGVVSSPLDPRLQPKHGDLLCPCLDWTFVPPFYLLG